MGDGVSVGVGVLVGVKVGVKVGVNVAVKVAVWVGVKVLVAVAVAVGVSVGIAGVLVAKAAGRGVFVPGSVTCSSGSAAPAGRVSVIRKASSRMVKDRIRRMNSSIKCVSEKRPGNRHKWQVYGVVG